MGILFPKAINQSALEGRQHTWSASEIREWATREFPDEFRALPDVSNLTFVDLGVDVPVLSLALDEDEDDGRSEPKDASKLVLYAFLSGGRFNNFGLISVDPSNGEYITRSPLRIYYRFELRDMCHPFRYLGDGKQQPATICRFRALITYYFMIAGHIDLVGGWQDYLRDFKMACFWIANQGIRPPFTSRVSTARTQFSDNVEEDISYADMDEHGFNEDGTQEHRDSGADIAGMSRSTTLVSEVGNNQNHRSVPPEAANVEAHTVTSVSKFSKHSDNLKRILDQAEQEYDELQEQNKRLKKDVQTSWAMERELRTVNDDLIAENRQLRIQSDRDQEQLRGLEKQSESLKESLAGANKELEEAETQVEAKITEVQKRFDVQLQKEIKSAKLQAEVKKERARANAAEAKLATIQAVFGRNI